MSRRRKIGEKEYIYNNARFGHGMAAFRRKIDRCAAMREAINREKKMEKTVLSLQFSKRYLCSWAFPGVRGTTSTGRIYVCFIEICTFTFSSVAKSALAFAVLGRARRLSDAYFPTGIDILFYCCWYFVFFSSNNNNNNHNHTWTWLPARVFFGGIDRQKCLIVGCLFLTDPNELSTLYLCFITRHAIHVFECWFDYACVCVWSDCYYAHVHVFTWKGWAMVSLDTMSRTMKRLYASRILIYSMEYGVWWNVGISTKRQIERQQQCF